MLVFDRCSTKKRLGNPISRHKAHRHKIKKATLSDCFVGVDGLATTQTKSAPLNAFPFRSPQGYNKTNSQEVIIITILFSYYFVIKSNCHEVV